MSKILLVEDNEINAKLVRDFLKFKGYNIIIVTSGLNVKEMTKKESPQLILMDIQLFGKSGIEAAKTIKQDKELQQIPIIAVSAFSKASLKEKELQNIFTDYIEKPIDLHSFSLIIEKYMV